MKIITKESLDALLLGIKQLLREDRCSFSEEEQALLLDCTEVIEVMLAQKPMRKIDLHDIARIVELIVRALITIHHHS